MALNKNETFDIEDDQFLDEDLDLNLDMDDFDTEAGDSAAKKLAKRAFGSLKAIGKGALTGALNALGNNVRGFDETMGLGKDIASGATELMSESIDETKKTVKSAHRLASIGIPMAKNLIPDKLYEQLDEKIVKTAPKDEEEQSEEARAEEYNNSMIETTLEDIFKKTQSAENLRYANASNERMVDRALARRSHQETVSAISAVGRHTNMISTFLRTTYMSYLKKNIELKYRSYFVLKENLSYTKAIASVFEKRLQEITEAINIPDAEKARAFRDRNANEKAGKGAGNFIRDYGKNLMESVKRGTYGRLEDLRQQMDLASGFMGFGSDMGPMFTFTDIINAGLGYGAKKISNWAMEKFIGKNSPFFKLLGGDLQEFLSSLGGRLNTMTKKSYNSRFMNFLTGFMPSFDRRHELTNLAATNPTDPATFDNLTRESIVSVIPTHLERIGDCVEGLIRSMRVKVGDESQKTYSLQERRLVTVNDQVANVEKLRTGDAAERYREAEWNKNDMITNVMVKYGVKTREEASKNKEAAAEIAELEKMFPILNRAFSNAGYNNVVLDPTLLKNFAENGYSYATDTYINALLGGTGEEEQEAAKVLLKNITRDGRIDQDAVRNISAILKRQTERHDSLESLYDYLNDTNMTRFDKSVRYGRRGEAYLSREHAVKDVGDLGVAGDIVTRDPYTGEESILPKESILRSIGASQLYQVEDMLGRQKTVDDYREAFIRKTQEKGIDKQLGVDAEELLAYAESLGFNTASALDPTVVADFVKLRSLHPKKDVRDANRAHVVRHEELETSDDGYFRNLAKSWSEKIPGKDKKKEEKKVTLTLTYLTQENADTFTLNYVNESNGKTRIDTVKLKKLFQLKEKKEPDKAYVESILKEIKTLDKFKTLSVDKDTELLDIFYLSSDAIGGRDFDTLYENQQRYAETRRNDYGTGTETFDIRRPPVPPSAPQRPGHRGGRRYARNEENTEPIAITLNEIKEDVRRIADLLTHEEHMTENPLEGLDEKQQEEQKPGLMGLPRRRKGVVKATPRPRPSIMPPAPNLNTLVFEGDPESAFHKDFRLFANKILEAVENGGVGGFRIPGFGGIGRAIGSGFRAVGRGLAGARDWLFGDEFSQGALSRGWNATKSALFGDEAEGKQGLFPYLGGKIAGGARAGKRWLFGDKETGARGLIPGAADLVFGNKDLDRKGLFGHAMSSLRRGGQFLFGNKEEGTRGLIPGTKDWLFGDKATGQDGLIPAWYDTTKRALFGDEETGEKGYLRNIRDWAKDSLHMPKSFRDLKARVFGGEDAEGNEHQGLIRKIRNTMTSLFGKIREKYVDVYRKDNLNLGHPLLKKADQERGVFFADGGKVEASKDINRPIVDSENNTLVSQHDIDVGLVDKDGDSIYDPKQTLLRKLWTGGKNVLKGIASRAANRLSKLLGMSDETGGKDKGFFKSLRIGLGISGVERYQRRIVAILEAIARDLGVNVPEEPKDEDTNTPRKPGVVQRMRSRIADRLREWADSMGTTSEETGKKPKGLYNRARCHIASMIGSVASRIDAPPSVSEDDLYARGYAKDNDGQWYNLQGQPTSLEEILKEVKQADNPVKGPSRPKLLPDLLKRYKGNLEDIQNQNLAKRLEDHNYYNIGPDQWYDASTGEVFSAKEASNRIKEEKKPESGPSFADQILTILKSINTSTEKTAKETEKLAEGPDTEGTEGEEGSAAQQRAKRKKEAEERKKRLEERKKQDEENRKKKEEARKAKEKEMEEKKKSGSSPFGLGGVADKLLNLVLGKNAAKVLHGRGVQALAQRALLRVGAKNSARALMTGGWKGLGAAALHSPALLATGLGALGGAVGLTGSRSSGAGIGSNLFSTAAGTTAGIAAALANPMTAGIAATALAGNAMREGWNDKKTLKNSWGGVNALDSQKGSSAVGNIANYLTFGMLNKFGGRKYVDKFAEASGLGHIAGGVGGQIAGTADVVKGMIRASKGEASPMTELEINRGRASLNANVKRGLPDAQEHLDAYEEAVRRQDWKTARRLSGVHVNASQEIRKGIGRVAKGTLAVATLGLSSYVESATSNAKPMTEAELEKARDYIAALKKANRPGADEIERKFEQAVESEDWPVARKLGKQLRSQTSEGRAHRRVLRNLALSNPLTFALGLKMSNQNEPLTDKEIEAFRKRCEDAIKAGNKPAEQILEKFDDAVTLQEWSHARKISNLKDKTIADLLAPGAKKLATSGLVFTGIGFALSDQNEPLTEQEIATFRATTKNAADKGDPYAQELLERFDEACLLQKWKVARRIADLPAKTVGQKLATSIGNFMFGNQTKPMTEEEIRTFTESCQRKIDMGDQVAKQKLDAFNEAVADMRWKTARTIADMKVAGIGVSAAKSGLDALPTTIIGRILYGAGKANEPMEERDIEEYRERMNKLIEGGSTEAKNLLDKFEDAVLDGNWRKARMITGVKTHGVVGGALKSILNRFNDKVKEVTDDKMTMTGDLPERYRLLFSKVKDSLGKSTLSLIDRFMISRLRNDMQAADLADLSKEQLDEWESRLRNYDKSVGDTSNAAISEYEKMRKEKSKLVERQTALLNEISASQKRTGVFEMNKREKLKRLFKEVESLDLEELDDGMLSLYDTELRMIDSQAVSTRDFSPEEKRKMLEMMKRQTKTLANIEQSKKDLGWKHPIKQTQLNKLKGQVESAPVEELTEDDFTLWDDELKVIDPKAGDSVVRNAEEQKRLLQMKRKKVVLRGLVEKSRKKARIMSDSRSTLGKLLKEMDGTADEETTEEDLSLWEDSYKAADPKAVGLNEQLALDEAMTKLLKKRDEFRVTVKQDIRKHQAHSNKHTKTFVKQANKVLEWIDSQPSEDYTENYHSWIVSNYKKVKDENPMGPDKKLATDHTPVAKRESPLDDKAKTSTVETEQFRKWLKDKKGMVLSGRGEAVVKDQYAVDANRSYDDMLAMLMKQEGLVVDQKKGAPTTIPDTEKKGSQPVLGGLNRVRRQSHVGSGGRGKTEPVPDLSRISQTTNEMSERIMSDSVKQAKLSTGNMTALIPGKRPVNGLQPRQDLQNRGMEGIRSIAGRPVEVKPPEKVSSPFATDTMAQKIQGEQVKKAQETADNTSKGVQALGQLTFDQNGLLQQILGEIHNVIGAVAGRNAAIDANIDRTAAKAVSIMKNYSDSKFQPNQPQHRSPATKPSVLNISKL